MAGNLCSADVQTFLSMRLSGPILGSRPLVAGTSSWVAGEEQMLPRSFEWRGTDACQADLNRGRLTASSMLQNEMPAKGDLNGSTESAASLQCAVHLVFHTPKGNLPKQTVPGAADSTHSPPHAQDPTHHAHYIAMLCFYPRLPTP